MAETGVPKRTMWASQLVEFNKPYQFRTVDIPRIRPNELLVKIQAAGFCHSDLQVWQGELDSPIPMTPSHEPVGTVVQIGDNAGHAWKIGDRVGVLNFKNACSQCPSCVSTIRRYGKTDPRYCERREAGGFHSDGAFAEYMVADSATTVALPESVSFEQGAPLLCAGATVWGAIQKFRGFLQQGDTVAVVGIGGLGQLGVQFCKALGYRTVAIDNHNGSLDLTEEMPPGLMPDFTVNSSSADATGRIMSYTRGEGLAAAVACTDPVAVNKWSLELLRVGGVLIPLGLPPSHWQFDPQKLLFRELVIRGNYVASKDEVDEMMRLVDQRGIRSQLTFVSRENIPNIMELYKARAFRGRLVVKF